MAKKSAITPKVGLICSPGGHLTEINLLNEAYQDFSHFFVTYESDNTRIIPGVRFLPRYNSEYSIVKKLRWFIRCLIIAYNTVREERPTLMISSGGGDLAIPFFLVGRLFHVKLLYIEHIGRFYTPSSTGKILYYLSDRFFVQSKALLRCYGKKAEYHGAVV